MEDDDDELFSFLDKTTSDLEGIDFRALHKHSAEEGADLGSTHGGSATDDMSSLATNLDESRVLPEGITSDRMGGNMSRDPPSRSREPAVARERPGAQQRVEVSEQKVPVQSAGHSICRAVIDDTEREVASETDLVTELISTDSNRYATAVTIESEIAIEFPRAVGPCIPFAPSQLIIRRADSFEFQHLTWVPPTRSWCWSPLLPSMLSYE